MINVNNLKEKFIYYNDVLYELSNVSDYNIKLNNNYYKFIKPKIYYNEVCILIDKKHIPIKDIIWMLNFGPLEEFYVVDYIDITQGYKLSNLYIRYKESSHNILSEVTNSGLAGICYNNVDGTYYVVRQGKKVRDSINTDWKVVLNYRLGLLNTKWFRPIIRYGNTRDDVWDYLSTIPPGYYKGPIETIKSNNSVIIKTKPLVALFKVINNKDI